MLVLSIALALSFSVAAADLQFLRAAGSRSRLLEGLPQQNAPSLDQVTDEDCILMDGEIVGDIGNGAIFKDDYLCDSNGFPPIGMVQQDENSEVFYIEGAVCCGPKVNFPGFGPMSQAGFCVQKIDDPADPTSDKVKFLPCDETVAAQMWRFSKTDHPSPKYMKGGLITNKEGGCLAIRGDVTEGKNLKVLECDTNNPKHHWLSTGDNVLPRDYRKYCAAPGIEPIKPRTAVVLYDCEDTSSLDN